MKKIKVNLDNNRYDILVNCDVTKELKKFFDENVFFKSILFVIDSNVFKFHKNRIEKLIGIWKGKKNRIVVTAKEQNKSYNTIQKIHSILIKNKHGRDTLIVSIGGGIIGDVAGFAAATYMRGVAYIQIPTTLLAMVDSSIGGKTGINFLNTKNIIGAFHQPQLVINDFTFLKTLSIEERLCGLGEIAKYAFLTTEYFFNYMSRNLEPLIYGDFKKINYLIVNSIEFKAKVVENDEKEEGLRKVLNLGHTFAHALEVEQDHKIKHGLAVVWGIACSLFLAEKIKLLSEKNLHKYLLLLEKFDVKIPKAKPGKIFRIMQTDKKNRDGKIKFVLLKSIGNILLDVEAERETVYKSIEESNLFFAK